MEEWLKRCEESQQKEDDLSAEFVLDYWDQDSEEENHPPHSLRRAAKNRIIREAIEKNQVYDIDRLFWNGGKLFGYDIYYNPADDRIPCFDVIKNNHHYVFSILWNWEKCHLVLCCFTIVKAIPYRARREIGFDTMFSLKDGLLQNLIGTEIENLIREVEKLIEDDKKGRLKGRL